jgi:hypothetical protein
VITPEAAGRRRARSVARLASAVAHRIAAAPPWLILGLAWSFLVIYAFPGQLTQDSYDHLREARTGVYSDAHPPIINLTWKLVDQVIAGPFGMLLLQSGLLLAGLYAILRPTFAPRPAAWWAAGVFVFPPVVTVMAVIWKDCVMAGLLAVGVAGLVSNRRAARIGGLVALTGAAAFRYNAFGATLPLIVLMFEWRPGMRWLPRYALATAAWLATTVTAFGVNAALTDKPMHYWSSSLAVYDIVGTLARVDGELPDAELRDALAGTGFRFDRGLHAALRAAYSPTDFFPIVTGDAAHRLWDLPLNGYVPAPEAQRDAIGRAWRRAVTTHPWQYIEHRLAVTGELLDLQSTRPVGMLARRDPHDPAHAISLGVATGWSSLQRSLSRGMRWTVRHTPWFVPWIYLVLTLAILPLAWRQRDVLAILLSGLLYEASLAVLVHSRDYRYSHWMVITTLLGCIVLATRRYRAARA